MRHKRPYMPHSISQKLCPLTYYLDSQGVHTSLHGICSKYEYYTRVFYCMCLRAALVSHPPTKCRPEATGPSPRSSNPSNTWELASDAEEGNTP